MNGFPCSTFFNTLFFFSLWLVLEKEKQALQWRNWWKAALVPAPRMRYSRFGDSGRTFSFVVKWNHTGAQAPLS
jgi:hypothetical protein